MSDTEHTVLVIDNPDNFPTLRFAVLQEIALENPEMSGMNAIRSFLIDPNSSPG